MIKIVYVMPYTYWGGGLQMNRLTLIQELIKQEELDITICVLEFSGRTSEILKEMGLKEVCLNSKAKFIYPQTTLALYKVLKEIEPDIVHTGNVDADIHGFIATRFLRNTKLIVEEIGSAQDRKSYMRIIHRFVYERADKVLCVSPDIENDMRRLEGLKRNDVAITYNPVNLKHLTGSKSTAEVLREEYNIQSDDFVFGIVSRLELFKGHTYLFQAFKVMQSNFDGVKLVVVGDGPLRDKLEVETRSLGIHRNTIFTGMVDNVGDFLNLFDVFVHPSLKEPFGISIIEAMFKGKPVISTSVGGPLDYINNEYNGLLVPPYTVAELTQGMERLLKDREVRINIGRNAARTVRERFMPEAYSEKILSIYREVTTHEK